MPYSSQRHEWLGIVIAFMILGLGAWLFYVFSNLQQFPTVLDFLTFHWKMSWIIGPALCSADEDGRILAILGIVLVSGSFAATSFVKNGWLKLLFAVCGVLIWLIWGVFCMAVNV
jgi:hypothetical protein